MILSSISMRYDGLKDDKYGEAYDFGRGAEVIDHVMASVVVFALFGARQLWPIMLDG